MNIDVHDVEWEKMREELFVLYEAMLEAEGEPIPTRVLRSSTEQMMVRWFDAKGWILPHLNADARREITVDDSIMTYTDINNVLSISKVEDLADRQQYEAVNSSLAFRATDAIRRLAFKAIDKGLSTQFLDNKVQDLRLIQSVLYDLRDQITPGMRLTKAFRIHVPAMVDNWAGRVTDNYSPLNAGDLNLAEANRLVDDADRREEVLEAVYDLMCTTYSILVSNLQIDDSHTLCISARPADILLQATHTQGGWRSCHNFWNGEILAGPQGLMLDGASVVAIAYNRIEPVKSPTPDSVSLPLEMPLQRWRTTVTMNNEGWAVTGAPYPGRNEVFTEATLNLVCDILEEETGERPVHRGYTPNVIRENAWSYFDGVHKAVGPSEEYEGVIVSMQDSICPLCGELRNTDDFRDQGEDPLGYHICIHCADPTRITCDICGLEHEHSDRMFHVEGVQVCLSCFENEFGICAECGETTRQEELYFDPGMGGDMCGYCVQEMIIATGRHPCSECREIIADMDNAERVVGVPTPTHRSGSVEYVCEHCVESLDRCQRCEGLVHPNNLVRVPYLRIEPTTGIGRVLRDQIRLCPACRSAERRVCPTCDVGVMSRATSYDDALEYGHCARCATPTHLYEHMRVRSEGGDRVH